MCASLASSGSTRTAGVWWGDCGVLCVDAVAAEAAGVVGGRVRWDAGRSGVVLVSGRAMSTRTVAVGVQYYIRFRKMLTCEKKIIITY